MLRSFKYQAIDKLGNRIHGRLCGISKQIVFDHLKAQKLQVLKITVQWNVFSKKISWLDLSIWTQSMAQFLKAGMDLNCALRLSISNVKTGLESTIRAVYSALNNGQTLSQSFYEHKAIFGDLFIALIETSAEAGQLHQSFAYASAHYSFLSKTKNRLLSKIYYPVLLLSVILVLSVYFIIGLIPIFANIIIESGQQLPQLTKAMCWIGAHIKSCALMLGLIGLVLFLNKNKLGFWFANKLMHKFQLAMFFSMLSKLLKTGMNPIKAVKLCGKVVNNVYKKQLDLIAYELEAGKSLAQSMKGKSFFDTNTITILSSGEQSNSIVQACEQIEGLSRVDLEKILDKIAELAQPILMIIVGFLFILLLFSAIMPLYQLSV